VRGRLARGRARLRDRLTRRGFAPAAVATLMPHEFSGPVEAAAVSWRCLAAVRPRAVAAVVSALVTLGGAMLAGAGRAGAPPQPPARAATAQTAPPREPEPDSGDLAAFRGGGPLENERASVFPPEVAARPVVFQGKVLDPEGKPVAGAKLFLITDA